MAPAGWQLDPTKRHELRFWDGSSWSDRVSDQAVTTIDSMESILSANPVTDEPPDGVHRHRLRWHCVESSIFTGRSRFDVVDSDELVVARAQYRGTGLSIVTIGEREYQPKTHLRWRTLVDPANDGEEVARWRIETSRMRTPRWAILARDTPALHRVRSHVKGEPSSYRFKDYAGTVALTVGVAERRGRWARLGPLNLGDATMIVACLAFDCTMPRGGGG